MPYPQSATFTPLRTPIAAISHFDLLGLRPENSEKCLKTSNRNNIFCIFKRKKVVSSA